MHYTQFDQTLLNGEKDFKISKDNTVEFYLFTEHPLQNDSIVALVKFGISFC